MNTLTRILIVDDDPHIVSLIKDYLAQYHFKVYTATNGSQMSRVLKEVAIDLIVLDIMLPGQDGISLCQQLRRDSDVLIIILSAADQESDRILGLEVGADDYLNKPFSPRELMARIKALTRRHSGMMGQSKHHHRLTSLAKLCFLDWTLDRERHRLSSADSITVPLTKAEYDLLLIFLQNPQRILSRDQLLDLLTGDVAGPYDRSIDIKISRLRKKLEKDPKDPKIIVTQRGDGYQFMPQVTEVL